MRARRSALLHVLPLVAPVPPAPPKAPSVEAITALVRTYGKVLIDGATADRLGEHLAARQAAHRAEGLFELIEHNIGLMEGYLVGYQLILSDLQKGTKS